MKKYKVYKHIVPNGKVYIGQTCQTTNKRFRHDGTGYAHSPYFYAAIQKYGWDNIEHIIVADGLDKNEANWLEKYLIRFYCSDIKGKGYNLTEGGDGSVGCVRSEEFKKNLSEKNKGKKLSDEHKRKISEGNKGKKLSEEHIRLLSMINKGRKLSPEHIEKLRQINKIRVRTPEEIEKSVSKRRGVPLSEETKKKLSDAHKGQHSWNEKEVECVETGERFFSAREAGRKHNLNSSNISFCCRGLRHTCGGFHWIYVEHPAPEVDNN